MSKHFFYGVVLLLSAFSLNVAFAAMEYPPDLAAEIELYPDAAVVQTMKVTGTTMAVIECTGEVAKIFDHYKKKLESSGWQIVNEFRQEGDSALVGEKGGKTLMIGIAPDPSGKVMVSLALSPKQ